MSVNNCLSLSNPTLLSAWLTLNTNAELLLLILFQVSRQLFKCSSNTSHFLVSDHYDFDVWLSIKFLGYLITLIKPTYFATFSLLRWTSKTILNKEWKQSFCIFHEFAGEWAEYMDGVYFSRQTVNIQDWYCTIFSI